MSEPGCESACELLIRFGLPCMHWMYACVILYTLISIFFLYLRWLIDGPEVVQDWRMSFRLPDNGADDDVDDDIGFRTAAFDRGRGDRMRGDRKNLIIQLAL